VTVYQPLAEVGWHFNVDTNFTHCSSTLFI
jgi:hypothetical protein